MLNSLRRFSKLIFGRYLWVTNTISCGALLTIGDIIQQNIELISGNTKESIDAERIVRMGTIGLAQGLPNHAWYTWLDRVLPGKSLAIIGKKVLADQLIASPFFSSTFFVGASLLEGCSFRNSVKEFQNKFLMVYLVDCAVWPPSQIINFLFVPAIYRVIYVNTLTIAWNAFLSYAKHFDHRTSPSKGIYPSGHQDHHLPSNHEESLSESER